MDEESWIISYTLNRDLKSVSIVQLKASKEFGEVGKYSAKECEEAVKIIRSTPLPEFKKRYWWGSKTLEEWEEFVNEVQFKLEKL